MQEKRLGRPRGAAAQKYSELVQVPVTPAQRRQLEQEAKAAGYRSLAAFVRETRLGQPPALSVVR